MTDAVAKPGSGQRVDMDKVKQVRRMLAEVRKMGVRRAQYGLANPHEHTVRVVPAAPPAEPETN